MTEKPQLVFPAGTHSSKLYFNEEPDYDKLREKLDFLGSYSDMINQNVLIIDYYKQNYFYISDNHFISELFKNSKDAHEDFRQSVVDKGRSDSLNVVFDFLSSFDKERLKVLRYSSVYPVQLKSGHIVMYSNQFRPLLFDDNGEIWMVMGTSTVYLLDSPGIPKIHVDFTDTNERFVYDKKTKKFVIEEIPNLTERETNVLVLSAQGYTSKEIAGIEAISSSTVKFHKQSIMTKLSVNTMIEAIMYARSHHLIDKQNKYIKVG